MIRMDEALLFFTGNTQKSHEQLKQEQAARFDRLLRLTAEYQGANPTGVENFRLAELNFDTLMGKMALEGLIVLDDLSCLPPDQRLLLAQWRYLREERECLLERASWERFGNTGQSYHMSAEFFEISKQLKSECPVSVLKPLANDEAREDGEMSESEAVLEEERGKEMEKFGNVVPSFPLKRSIVHTHCHQTENEPNSGLEPEPVHQTQVVVEAPPAEIRKINPGDASKTEKGWEYLRHLKRLTEEQRDQELRQVQIRYQRDHPNGKLMTIMPEFDPTADAGILVTYGMLIPPKAMNINPDNLLLIEAGRRFRDILVDLPGRGKTKSPGVTMPVPVTSTKKFAMSNAEIAAIKQKYVSLHKGVSMAKVMPVFDPSTDLGKLILWGEYIPPQSMQISALHLSQIQETRAARGLDPVVPNHTRLGSVNLTTSASEKLIAAGADFASQLGSYSSSNQYKNTIHDMECAVVQLQGAMRGDPAATEQQRARLQRLLARAQALEGSVPVDQRVKIPKVWISLSNYSRTLEDRTSDKTLATRTGKRAREKDTCFTQDTSMSPQKRSAPSRDLQTESPSRSVASKESGATSSDPQPSCDESNDPREDAELEANYVELGAVTVDVPLPQDDKRDALDCELARDASRRVQEKCETTSTPNDCSELTDQQRVVQLELERMQELYNMWIAD